MPLLDVGTVQTMSTFLAFCGVPEISVMEFDMENGLGYYLDFKLNTYLTSGGV